LRDNLRQGRVLQEDDLGGISHKGLRLLDAVMVNIKQDIVTPVNNPPVSLWGTARCERSRRQARQQNQKLSHFFNSLTKAEVNGQVECPQTGAARLTQFSSDYSTFAHYLISYPPVNSNLLLPLNRCV
jgi:hypothetical protein